MLTAVLFAVGFKGASALFGAGLLAGGYLGFKYGGSVERKAAEALSKAGAAASSASNKV